MRDLHICLKMVGSAEWVGGMVYMQNLAWAIAGLPAAEKRGLRLSVTVHPLHREFVEPIRYQVDKVIEEGSLPQKFTDRVLQFLALRLHLLPRRLLNPHRFDFVYPDLADARAPYRWGGWIPDFQHHHLPELFSAQDIVLRDAVFKQMADHASVVILSSRMARDDFCSLFPHAAARGEVLNFVSWIEPAWLQEDPESYRRQYELPEQFFFLANQFWIHKDHRVVVEALGLLKERGLTPPVVCSGSTNDFRHPGYFQELTARIAELGLTGQVRILGFIPRLDQVQLMRRSLAVIQPSRFEGWSTVVEEARLLGKTVLLSDFPVHQEQNPPHARFFRRGQAEELASLMGEVYTAGGTFPDPAREAAGQEDNRTRFAAFGRHFLEIVRKTVNGAATA